MKKFLKIMLCIMGSLLAVIVAFWFSISYTVNYKKTTCDTSVSPDGKYELTLQAVGEPDWPFGSASGRLVLKEGEDKISQTDFELHNDGASISSSCWKVTWHEDYVEIILSGEEQFDEQVILYFDGTKEIQQLTDVADIEVEYPSGERLDESRVITEQSFDVELNDWGEVQFVSYLPTYETLWEDVSFVLAKDNQIIYYFPECYENNSTEKETFEFYEKIQKEYDNVKVLYWKDEFNYSAINNFGVKEADGEYILLLNNDTEIINDDCLSDMLSICQREEVGIVGARLYYPDDTIQHAGVVIGFGGIAGHTFIGQPRFEPGYFARAMCTQDYSAVTAACMMTKKNVFEEVGGLTEEFKVAFNDIDYCMKVRKLGKLVVYDAFAELYHYESKSRGLEDTPEKVARFNSEIERFRDRWEDILEKGDPYYNPNLTLDKSDFSLREY